MIDFYSGGDRGLCLHQGVNEMGRGEEALAEPRGIPPFSTTDDNKNDFLSGREVHSRASLAS